MYAAGNYASALDFCKQRLVVYLSGIVLTAPLTTWPVLTDGVFGSGVAIWLDPSRTNGQRF